MTDVAPNDSPAVQLPAKPFITDLVSGDGEVEVHFSIAQTPNGKPLTAFVLRSNQGQVAEGLISPMKLIGLINGEPYTFAVMARNEDGDGPWSDWSEETRPRTVPGGPVVLSAEPGDGKLTVEFRAPAADGGSPITQFTATARREEHDDEAGIAVHGQHSPLIVDGLENGVTYTITVTATNEAGASGPSTPRTTVTPYAEQQEDEPWRPFPSCARFDIAKPVNQAQLQDEIATALGHSVTISITRTDPDKVEGYLWVVPEDVDEATVTEAIAAHDPDNDWGIPQTVRDYRELLRKITENPDVELTTAEMQVAVKGLMTRMQFVNG